MHRRDFLALSALGGGAVWSAALAGCSHLASGSSSLDKGFCFVQLSDTHWGYQGPANPEAAFTLRKAVAAVNQLPIQPDFVFFTGDLTHTTDDPVERRRRLATFKDIVAGLHVKQVHFIPGEHDASLDQGAAFKELFGDTYYSFDHAGVHFIALDNVSDPGARVTDAQLAWLQADLAQRQPSDPIVVFTHRPLFDLAPKWDWATRNGAQVMDLLAPFPHVTVFYGHIHQEHHHMTGHIAHHSAKSLIFPLPAPGTQAQRSPLPWDATHPNQGLGFREVEVPVPPALAEARITEFPVART